MRFVKEILHLCIAITLFFVSWPPNSFPYFIFISFIPVLRFVFDSERKRNSTLKLVGFLFLTFFGINFTLTSWVMNAHVFGGLFASMLNTILMSSVFLLLHIIRNRQGDNYALIAFPILWIAFEYLHLNWELSWPWMTLGNVFAEKTNWIQWYEYTGVLGGSLWILIVNCILYKLQKKYQQGQSIKGLLLLLGFSLTPIIVSNNLKTVFVESEPDSLNVVVVQPNFEPHEEKFNTPQSIQLNRVENLLDSLWELNPDLVVLPETFITDWIWESRIEMNPTIRRMKSWLINNPKTHILTGASTGKVMDDVDPKKNTARRSANGTWYEVFNSALLISADHETQIFHKSKLVPGAEMTPYSFFLKPLLDVFPIELGGSIGNFGVNDSIYNMKTDLGLLSSMICYESVYGEYLSTFTDKGANWICIITNDGWWGKTYGHQQHQAYAKLRAIENRKYVIRSANTGISSIINPYGEVEELLPYNTSGVISSKIDINFNKTHYSKFGDYIGRLASFLAIIYLLQVLINVLKVDASDLKMRKS